VFRIEQDTTGNLTTGSVVLQQSGTDVPRVWILRNFQSYRNPFVNHTDWTGDLYEYIFEEYGTCNEMVIVAPLDWQVTVLVSER
jgi:hypothetical protein